jgi:hypothetical protein
LEILKRDNIPLVKPIESAQKPPKPATLTPWKSFVLIATIIVVGIAIASSSDGDNF